MELNIQTETVVTATTGTTAAGENKTELQTLHATAERLAMQLPWLPRVPSSDVFAKRARQARATIFPMLAAVDKSCTEAAPTDDARWMRDNSSLISSELAAALGDAQFLRKLPHVRAANGEAVPRVVGFAKAYFEETSYRFEEQSFVSFTRGFQKASPLELREFNVLSSALKLVLLEEISRRGRAALDDAKGESHEVGVCVQSLREVSQTTWLEFLEPLILFDYVLRQDPAGAYANMEPESRMLYRKKVAAFAERSDFTEIDVAQEAISLAKQAQSRGNPDPRIA
ncbi:MAG: hypothetical protein ACRD3B_08745, partial [Candidatus Sulfotelmatobacter sp.]